MAQRIDVPGMGVVEFPDGMSDAQISAAIQKNLNPTPKPSNLNVGANSLVKGAAGIADLLPNAAVNVTNLLRAGGGMVSHALGGKAENMPDLIPPDTLSGFHKIGEATGAIRPENEPQTPGQRVLDMTGQVIGGGGVNPVAVSRNLARGQLLPVARDLTAATVGGSGAGLAAELTKDVDLNKNEKNPSAWRDLLSNAIRAGSTFAGGAAPGMIIAAPGTAGERVAAATKGVTSEQLALAKALETEARNRGAPITGYEAIQAITGQNPKMQTQQRIAEQSDHAKPLTIMMQARPGANTALMENAASTVAPKEMLPDTLAGQLQAAAEGSITAARQQGNAQAKPYYDSAYQQSLSPAQASATVFEPALKMAIDKVRKDPLSRAYDKPANSVEVIDAAKRYLDDISNKAGIQGKNTLAANASQGADLAKIVGDAASPDYATARKIVSDNMRNVVDPMKASQVGKLSESNKFETQAGTLLPEKPMDVTPSVVKRTVDTISKQDPDITRKFLAQYLRGTFNEANQQNMTGENVFGGSKFAAKVAGNPAQEENLLAGLKASGANTAEIEAAIRIFRAQGMKPPVNSATQANIAEAGAGSGKGMVDLLMGRLSAATDKVDRMRANWSNKQMVEALAAPDSVRRIEELARINGAYSPTKQQLLAAMLAATRGATQAQGQ